MKKLDKFSLDSRKRKKKKEKSYKFQFNGVRNQSDKNQYNRTATN